MGHYLRYIDKMCKLLTYAGNVWQCLKHCVLQSGRRHHHHQTYITYVACVRWWPVVLLMQNAAEDNWWYGVRASARWMLPRSSYCHRSRHLGQGTQVFLCIRRQPIFTWRHWKGLVIGVCARSLDFFWLCRPLCIILSSLVMEMSQSLITSLLKQSELWDVATNIL